MAASPADSSRQLHQADRLRPVRGSRPRQHLHRGCRRLGRARGRAGQQHGPAGSGRDNPSADDQVERTARQDLFRQAGDRPQLPEPSGALGHHDGDPLRRGGQAASPELIRQPAHRGRLEAAQSAGCDTHGSGEWRVASGARRESHQLATRHSPLATRHSPLATRHSPLATRHSPLATRHSPLATRHSPLATRNC